MISAPWRKLRAIGGNTRRCPKLKVMLWSLAKKRLFKTNLNFDFGSSVGVHMSRTVLINSDGIQGVRTGSREPVLGMSG